MKHLTLCIVCLGLSFLTGCQSTDNASKNANLEANQKSSYFTEAKALLDKLEASIKQGEQDQLRYFAPLSFKIALKEFNNATEEYTDIVENGASSFNVFSSETEQYEKAKKEILGAINIANQKLTVAYKNKETTQRVLTDVIAQNEMLTSIGSPEVYSKDYKSVSARINGLIEYIDEGNVEKAQENQPKLLLDMQMLEVRTVRKNFLGQLNADIALIKDKDLAIDVPISHKRLIATRDHADTIITVTPRATDEIKAAVELANFELAHLYHIAKEVSALKKTDSKEYEKYLLEKETLLHTVSESLGTKDVRDLAMTKQFEAIALQAGTVKDKLETANSAISALQSDSSASSEATESLRQEFKEQLVNMNAKYDALVVENTKLNDQIKDRSIEVSRLKAEKSAAIQREKDKVLAKELEKKALAKKAAEQKAAEEKALAEKAQKAAQEKALAEQEKAQQEAEAIAAAATVESESVKEAETKVVTPAVEQVDESSEVTDTITEAVTEPATTIEANN